MKIRFISACLLFCVSYAQLVAQHASFTASVVSGCSPLLVEFDAGASTGQAPLTYRWSFGNGNTTEGTDQQAPGAVYAQPGTYTVSLVVEDASGGSSPVFERQIDVFANPQAAVAVDLRAGCPPPERAV